MITKKEAITIAQATVLTDLEQLQVIRKYIFDRKGVDVGEINQPSDIVQLNYMSIAFDSACRYYLNPDSIYPAYNQSSPLNG